MDGKDLIDLLDKILLGDCEEDFQMFMAQFDYKTVAISVTANCKRQTTSLIGT